MKIQKLFLYLITISFLVWACDGSESPFQPDSEEEISPVEPVQLEQSEALFADPDAILDGNYSTVILDRLTELIDAVPEGGSIYISIYQFQHSHLVDALKRANSRDVKLFVMLDISDRSDNRRTINELTVLDGEVEIVRVNNNASASAINHNKFALFSELTTEDRTVEDVLFQTSQNFTESGSKKIQDGTILIETNLYGAYLDYWKDMESLASEQMDDFEYREYEVSDGDIRAYFYPKRKDGDIYGRDTIVEFLDGIDDPSSATVKIGMSAWTDSRRVILEKLSELETEGADLQIVTKSSVGPETYDRLQQLSEDGAFIKIYSMGNSDQPRINIHSKFMMIDGVWNGDESKILVTGTQNFTINALRNNNEVSLLFRDHKFFSQYEAYFDKLKNLPGVCCDF